MTWLLPRLPFSTTGRRVAPAEVVGAILHKLTPAKNGGAAVGC